MNKTKIFLIISTILLFASCSDIESYTQNALGNVNNFEYEETITPMLVTNEELMLNQIKEDYSIEDIEVVENPVPIEIISDDIIEYKCNHEVQSYHTISGALVDYIGNDIVISWVEKMNSINTNDEFCASHYANIYNFVRDFNISRDVFEELHYKYSYYTENYNIELIYGDNVDEFEKYYLDESNNIEANKLYTEYLIKLSIREYIENIYGETLVRKKDYSIISEWSIAEVVIDYNIPINIIENFINIYEKEGADMYNYDLSKIYQQNTDLIELINTEQAYIVDEIISNMLLKIGVNASFV